MVQQLSEKNDIIRRQIELNLMQDTSHVAIVISHLLYYSEREEDIERKEYLLRRELRTLSAVSGNARHCTASII